MIIEFIVIILSNNINLNFHFSTIGGQDGTDFDIKHEFLLF